MTASTSRPRAGEPVGSITGRVGTGDDVLLGLKLAVNLGDDEIVRGRMVDDLIAEPLQHQRHGGAERPRRHCAQAGKGRRHAGRQPGDFTAPKVGGCGGEVHRAHRISILEREVVRLCGSKEGDISR